MMVGCRIDGAESIPCARRLCRANLRPAARMARRALRRGCQGQGRGRWRWGRRREAAPLDLRTAQFGNAARAQAFGADRRTTLDRAALMCWPETTPAHGIGGSTGVHRHRSDAWPLLCPAAVHVAAPTVSRTHHGPPGAVQR
jgi:hypothetical protein